MTDKPILWTGNLQIDHTNIQVFRAGEEIKVNIMHHEQSRSKESNFNWPSGILKFRNSSLITYFLFLETAHVKVVKYPKSFLKPKDKDGTKMHLKKYLSVRL